MQISTVASSVSLAMDMAAGFHCLPQRSHSFLVAITLRAVFPRTTAMRAFGNPFWKHCCGCPYLRELSEPGLCMSCPTPWSLLGFAGARGFEPCSLYTLRRAASLIATFAPRPFARTGLVRFPFTSLPLIQSADIEEADRVCHIKHKLPATSHILPFASVLRISHSCNSHFWESSLALRTFFAYLI